MNTKDIENFVEHNEMGQDGIYIPFENGGEVLLAPNGKPSNLTPEQYRLVRTPAFKKWFGDWENSPETSSKVVDNNGEPLVVYHGSVKDFSIFSFDKLGSGIKANLGYLGIYFTDDKTLATDFTRIKWTNPNSKFKKDSKVYEVFLKIKNPKYMTIDGFILMDNKNRSEESIKNVRKDLLKKGYDGIIVEKAQLYWQSKMREFDGKQYIILQNNKNIKLADGTNTTFDTNNPDIRYADGGLIFNENDDIKIGLRAKDKNFVFYNGESIGSFGIRYLGDVELKDAINFLLGEVESVNNISLKKCAIFETGFVINEEYRNRGYGRKIIKKLFDNYKIDNILLYAFYEQEAVGFWQKMGGQVVYDDGVVVFLLLKKYADRVEEIKKQNFMAGGKITKNGGDCYYIAGQFTMGVFSPKKIDYIGTPYLVHAEVQGQGHISNIRYGHAWIEDDINVYDFSNNRELIIPKLLYYAIGDIKTDNPKKYRKYTFQEARKKMVDTKHYGCWDLEVDYANGGTINEKSGYRFYKVTKKYKDIFVVKISTKDERHNDMVEMINDLHERGYILKEISKEQFENFDYSSVSKEDLVEFMSGINYYGVDDELKYESGGILDDLWSNKIIDNINFKEWFGDSLFIKDNEPLIFYHETLKQNLPSIEENGFDTSILKSRKNDNLMPDAIFLKKDIKEIGVGGAGDKVQIPVYVSIPKEKILFFNDRTKFYEYLSPDKTFYKRYWEGETYDKSMSKKFDELYKLKNYFKGVERNDKEWKPLMDKYKIETDKFLKEWGDVNDKLALITRKRVTEILKHEGIEAIVILNDEGSFGRKVWTLAVLNPYRIKAVDNVGSFNKRKKGIKYEVGGNIDELLTKEQVENLLNRKLDWWKDNIVYINGIEYKKVFLRNEYKIFKR